MTDQKYKLVPLQPTPKMLGAIRKVSFSRHADMYRAAIAAAPECKEPPVAWWNGMQETPLGGMPPSIQWGADAEDTRHDIPLYAGFNPVHTHPVAPEPVCRWTFVGIGFDSECDKHITPDLDWRMPYPFCPHCGRKVEVVGDE